MITYPDAVVRHSLREIQRLADVESEFDYYFDLDELINNVVSWLLGWWSSDRLVPEL